MFSFMQMAAALAGSGSRDSPAPADDNQAENDVADTSQGITETTSVIPGETKEIPSSLGNGSDIDDTVQLLAPIDHHETSIKCVENTYSVTDQHTEFNSELCRSIENEIVSEHEINIVECETHTPSIEELLEQADSLDNTEVEVTEENNTTNDCDLQAADTQSDLSDTIANLPTETSHVAIEEIIAPTIVEEQSESAKMPETQESVVDRSPSPALLFSVCRYRWEKTLSTQSPTVVFITINKKATEPVQLTWSESTSCYYSEELRRPVGTYVGHLVVDGKFHQVEDITIKHYTFEVDLYLKEDIIEDEVDKSGLAKAETFVKQNQQQNGNVADIDTYSDINYTPTRAATRPYTDSWVMDNQQVTEEQVENGIHITSKYEALVKSQMAHTKSDFDDFVNATEGEGEVNEVSKKLDSDINGRRSPIGQDGGNQYQDGDDTVLKTLDMGHVYHSDAVSMANLNGSLVEDDVERKSVMSSTSASHTPRSTPQAVVDDVLGNGHNRTPIYSTESPVHSRHSSAHSSARQTPISPDVHSVSQEPVRAEYTNLSNNMMTDIMHDALDRTITPPNTREGSQNNSARQTPQLEQIADVLNPADRHSPIRHEYLLGSPHTSDHSAHSSLTNSASNSQRQTPQKDLISNSLRSSQEKLYTSAGYRRSGSDHGSVRSDSSRPQSLTSEQELTNYYESADPHRVSSTGGTPVQASPSIPPVGGSPRTGSAASLPSIGSQQRHSADRRSTTPDNYIRVPVMVKGPLLPNRQTPTRATPVSNASSRTVTPVNQADTQEISRLQERIAELENKIGNQRKLLSSCEQEVVGMSTQLRDVKEINKVLQEELDHRRARASPGPQIAELERKYGDLLAEKEALNAEVFRLQDVIRDKDSPGLNNYDPNSRAALQRKIDELGSQVQDLHEANESAVDEIHGLEGRVKDLQARNDELQESHASNTRGLQNDNDRLNQEIVKLKDESSHTEVTDYRLKIELQQVKEDNRGLRERNYQLHDDNLKLKDELAELRKSMEAVEASRKAYSTENYRALMTETYERPDASSQERSRGGDRDRGDKYSSARPTYDGKIRYDAHTDRTRGDKTYEAELLSKTESSRYQSYRSGPDGGSGDKSTQSRYKYDSRPPIPIPERPSALGPHKPEYSNGPQSLDRQRLERLEDHEHNKRDRRRTASADVEYKSPPLSAYSDLAKTTPNLSGRSRAIYKQLSELRSRSRSRSPGNRQRGKCESPTDIPECNSDNQNRSKSSSKVFVNRYIPPNKQPPPKPDDEAKHHSVSDRVDLTYARTAPAPPHRTLDTYKREDKPYDPRPLPPPYPDEGEFSDTATDILVSAQPLERVPGWSHNRQRRGSVGSDGSNSSFSDIDEQITSLVRKRSKSADGREVLRRMVPSGTLSRSGPTTPVKGERMTMKTTTIPANTGFRSITPQPLPTQHNKSMLSFSPGSMSLTQGLRPFAPRSAGDLQINDVIKFSRQGGKLSQGTIKFIGHLPGRGDIYLGVELDKEDGKHDGTFEEIRYFKCKPNKGVFVAYNKVVMAWTCY